MASGGGSSGSGLKAGRKGGRKAGRKDPNFWANKMVIKTENFQRPSRSKGGKLIHRGVLATCQDGSQYLIHHAPDKDQGPWLTALTCDYKVDKNKGYVVTLPAEVMGDNWQSIGGVRDLSHKPMRLGNIHGPAHDKRLYNIFTGDHCIGAMDRANAAVDRHLNRDSKT